MDQGTKNINIKIQLFNDLDEEQINKILGSCIIKNIPSGESIIREGETGTSLFILQKGVVEIYKKLTLKIGDNFIEDKERKLARLREEDGVFFGEMVFVGEKLRTATVRAVTDCSLLEIDRDKFNLLVEKDYKMGFIIMKNISEIISHRLRQANEDIIKLTTALSIIVSSKAK